MAKIFGSISKIGGKECAWNFFLLKNKLSLSCILGDMVTSSLYYCWVKTIFLCVTIFNPEVRSGKLTWIIAKLTNPFHSEGWEGEH